MTPAQIAKVVATAVEEALADQRKRWMRYVALLDAEIKELVPLAHVHGWRSQRHEEGKRMREELSIADDDIRAAQK